MRCDRKKEAGAGDIFEISKLAKPESFVVAAKDVVGEVDGSFDVDGVVRGRPSDSSEGESAFDTARFLFDKKDALGNEFDVF